MVGCIFFVRREETAIRAQRKREANRERRRRLERRRLATAEATRIKHEGPSLAEVVSAGIRTIICFR